MHTEYIDFLLTRPAINVTGGNAIRSAPMNGAIIFHISASFISMICVRKYGVICRSMLKPIQKKTMLAANARKSLFLKVAAIAAPSGTLTSRDE